MDKSVHNLTPKTSPVPGDVRPHARPKRTGGAVGEGFGRKRARFEKPYEKVWYIKLGEVKALAKTLPLPLDMDWPVVWYRALLPSEGLVECIIYGVTNFTKGRNWFCLLTKVVGGLYSISINQVPSDCMWVRKLIKHGDKLCVGVPTRAQVQLGLERGGFVHVRIVSGDAIVVQKFEPAKLPDRVLAAMRPLPEVSYG